MHKRFFKNKKVLITGGTGSLGKALVKKLLEYGCKVIVYSRDEGKQALFFKRTEDLRCVIGDIRDPKKLDTTMRLHKPDFVIHAAALKRVDDMEFYPDECIKTNINGSENVAIAALSNNVKKCILVSTDKACQPVNVYGSSKFIAERIFTNFDYNSESTVFSSVRYGNVIASRGSFIPLWMSKILKQETITVTSMECSRFLFTLSDAVDTVLSSIVKAQGGEVFIPKIKSYNMSTVIEAIKKITDTENLNLSVTGLRPGEKVHEDMMAKTELPYAYDIDNNLIAVLPQYTQRNHSYKRRYEGLEFNSSLHLESDYLPLSELILKGLDQAN